MLPEIEIKKIKNNALKSVHSCKRTFVPKFLDLKERTK